MYLFAESVIFLNCQDKIKLVLADDNAEYRALITEKLRDCAQVVASVKSGAELISAVKSFPCDLIITDAALSEVDGITAVREINKLTFSEKPEIYFLSSFLSPEISAAATDLGVSMFMLKPYNLDALAEQVRSAQINKINRSSAPIHLQTPDKKPDLEVEVTNKIHHIGMPAHVNGYKYLREAIMISVLNQDAVNSITKELYPAVAKKYKTTPSRVERSIRTAIEIAWNRGDIDVLQSYFGYTVSNSKGKPTNSEFISLIADKIRLELKAF